MKAFLLATIITGYLFTDKDPQRTLDQQYKAYVMAQQITPVTKAVEALSIFITCSNVIKI